MSKAKHQPLSKINREFIKIFPETREKVALRNHSTYQIGGPADLFYELTENDELPKITSLAQNLNIPFLVIGGGSNILFDDEGFRGLIIKMKTKNISFNNTEITADAGVTIAQLILQSIKHNLTGLEPWIGLPGTVGGAVRGNAGCNGLETSEVLTSAQIFFPEINQIKNYQNAGLQYEYRSSQLKKNKSPKIVLEATFKVHKSHLTPEQQREIMTEIRASRTDKQPQQSSCGSFFQNPALETAGSLIEKVGLKGEKIGNAQISEKHANFIINLGDASASDVLELGKMAQNKVKERFGIELQEEVQIFSQNAQISLSKAVLH